MDREEKMEQHGISPEVKDNLSSGEVVLALHVAGLLKEEACSFKASHGFAGHVMDAVESVPRRGPASSRYDRIIRSESRNWKKFMTGYWKAVIPSAAAVVICLALSAYWRFEQAASNRALVEAVLRNSDSDTRRRQRSETSEFVTRVVNGRANVSGIIPDGPVYLVGQYDDMTGEICIFAYQEDQWRALDEMLGGRGDAALQEAWATVRRRAKLSDVHDGQLGIPEELWTEYLDSSDAASVFAFVDRSELWNPENLTEYRRGPVRIQPHPNWEKL